MKKIFLSLLVVISLFMITGCVRQSAKDFKEEYEAINGRTIRDDIKYRDLTIPEENPYIKVSIDDIAEKIKNKETFYLYVGDKLCPWCRSVLEKSIEVAKDQNIDKIYYIEIWDDEGNEILRDKYELTPILTKTIEGTEEYKFLLEQFDSVLEEYFVYDEEGHNITTEEKRIYAPSYFFVRDGKVVKMIDGVSDKQKDSREELTKEMLDDEEQEFISLFKLKDSCDSNGC